MTFESMWTEVRLEDVASEITVGYVGSMTQEYVSSGIPFLRSLNILPYQISRQDLKYISPGFHKRIAKSTLRPGDLAVVRTGKPGTAAVIPQELGEVNCSDLVIIRPSEKLDVRYLAYYLNSQAGQNCVDSRLVGSVQKHFNIRDARSLKLRLPPLPEQKAIAHILGTLDDKIEQNREMNKTLEVMAWTIFNSWFVGFDPVRAKMEGRQPAGIDAATAELFPDAFEESALGMIPKGWKVLQIKDIAARVAMGPFGSRITTDNFVSNGVPVIRGSNLVGGFNEYGFVYVTQEKADQLKSSVAFPGDIVFTHRGTLGQVGLIPQSATYPRYVVSQSQMLLAVDRQQVSSKLIYQFFRSPLGQHALLANTNSTGVPAIASPSTTLKGIELVIPPKPISDHFEQIINPLDLKRELNIKESHSLASIRDTLLPKLLSGEIRVKEAQKVVEEVM